MNPRDAADRYRDELARLQDGLTAVAAEKERARLRRAAEAREHRDSARAIRAHVEQVWERASPALAPAGVSLLEQLYDDVPDAVPPADPRTGRQRARDACREAQTHAAEVRGMMSAGGTTALGLVGATVLAVGLGALLHGTKLLAGVPCLGVGALLAVLVVAGNRTAGSRPVGRALLLGAAGAGIGVLVTTRGLQADPTGILASIVVIGLAVRFAVFGRRPPTPPPERFGPRGRR